MAVASQTGSNGKLSMTKAATLPMPHQHPTPKPMATVGRSRLKPKAFGKNPPCNWRQLRRRQGRRLIPWPKQPTVAGLLEDAEFSKLNTQLVWISNLKGGCQTWWAWFNRGKRSGTIRLRNGKKVVDGAADKLEARSQQLHQVVTPNLYPFFFRAD